MAKYTARPPRGDRPLLVLGISGVMVLEGEAAVPVSMHHLSAWGRWVRDVEIPHAASERLAELAERFEIVWASEWGHNAHTAFREALELPEEPWAFLPVQFDKLRMIFCQPHQVITDRFVVSRLGSCIHSDAQQLGPERLCRVGSA